MAKEVFVRNKPHVNIANDPDDTLADAPFSLCVFPPDSSKRIQLEAIRGLSTIEDLERPSKWKEYYDWYHTTASTRAPGGDVRRGLMTKAELIAEISAEYARKGNEQEITREQVMVEHSLKECDPIKWEIRSDASSLSEVLTFACDEFETAYPIKRLN